VAVILVLITLKTKELVNDTLIDTQNAILSSPLLYQPFTGGWKGPSVCCDCMDCHCLAVYSLFLHPISTSLAQETYTRAITSLSPCQWATRSGYLP